MGVFGVKEMEMKEGIIGKRYKEKDWKPKLIEYLRSMEKEEHKYVLSLFQLYDNKYGNQVVSYKNIKNYEMDNSKLPVGYVRRLMKQTFNIDFKQSKCNHYMEFDNTYWDTICKENETFLTKKIQFLEDREIEMD